MSKSNHPTNYNCNPDHPDQHPYAKYRWWQKHGNPDIRRWLEKRFRRETKLALLRGEPCPAKPADPKWFFH